jgi:HD-like signal output (HDOD) protein
MLDARDLEPTALDLVRREVIRVPPQHSVALRLQALVGSGKYGTGDLVRVVAEDQALAALLLRYANSATFRGVEQITSLHDAITRMGAAEVCRTALALSVAAQAVAPGPLAELRRKWWRQAYMSALVCEYIGDRRGTIRRDDAFVCGLLHDFGRVVGLACFEHVLAHNRDARRMPAAVWEQSIDHIHVELGTMIGKKWNFSAALRAAIASHHRPETSGRYKTLVDVVNASDAVVDLGDRNARITAKDLQPLPGLTPHEVVGIAELIPTIASKVAEVSEMAGGIATTGTYPVCQIEKPATALDGPGKAARFEVQLIQPAGTILYAGTTVWAEGLAFRGKVKLRENSIVRLTIGTPEGPFKVFANVVLCIPDNGVSHIEVRLFGLDRSTQDTWARFFETA